MRVCICARNTKYWKCNKKGPPNTAVLFVFVYVFVVYVFGQCFEHVNDFLSATKCVFVCAFLTCMTARVSVFLSLFPAPFSWSFVCLFCIYRFVYGGMPYIGFFSAVFFFFFFFLSSYEFRYFIAPYKTIYFSLILPFSRLLVVFCTYAPVAYLCQSTNEEKNFLLLKRANIQLNSQYI